MRKVHRIIIGMLVAGVLILGIGSGVAFAEFSSFQYGEEVVMEGSERFTKTITYKVPVQEDKKELGIEPFEHWHYEIVEDENISKDEVQFVISYLSDHKNVKPTISEENVEFDEKCAYIVVDSGYDYNELRDVMRLKDYVLNDIQNKRINSYRMDGVEKVEIHVHPEADFVVDVEYLEEYIYVE